MRRSRTMLVLALGALASGCFVFDDAHLNELADGGARLRDGGGPDGDGGGGGGDDGGGDGGAQMLDDHCGEMVPSMVVNRTRQDILVDTRDYSNQVTSSCGGAPTLGKDAFIGIDIQAGEYWHFHLRNDPTDALSATRQPALYMLFAPTGSCDSRDCRFNSDVCAQTGDEHFGFVADSSGRWFLGVDDRLSDGGRYILDAIRPVCGDMVRDHGEACDDGNGDAGDGCTPGCLRELTMELPSEIEPNDNPHEANFLMVDATGEFVVEGAVGGPGVCLYGDTFAVDVPAGNRVEVQPLQTDGSECADETLTAGYDLAIQNSAFTDVVRGMTDATTGCAVARTTALSGGLYYLSAYLSSPLDRPATYRLRVRVLP